MTLADAPTGGAAGPPSAVELSVVVPSVNGWGDLRGCLDALTAHSRDVRLEVLVVDRCGEAVRAHVRAAFPRARLLAVPPTTTIPGMRHLAFARAHGDSVAVIEDHVIVPAGWARALLDAQRDAPVVGGSVENAATERVVDWAAFLCEYSHCLPPLAAGPTDWLTGNNVVYPRALLARYADRLRPDQWENHLHAMLHADGVALTCRPEIRVGHLKRYTIREYLTQRYLYARSYAGARVATAGVGKRLAYGAASAGLPPLLFWRTVARVSAKRRHRVELLRGLPLIALFVCAWAAGEVVGSWFGSGDALERVC